MCRTLVIKLTDGSTIVQTLSSNDTIKFQTLKCKLTGGTLGWLDTYVSKERIHPPGIFFGTMGIFHARQ